MNKATNYTVDLPAELFEASGIYGHPCNVSVGNNAIVILREKLTAIEAIEVFEHLADVGDTIIRSISDACEKCSHCSGGCGYAGESLGFIDIPPIMRKLYGIPENIKIRATLDEESKRVILTEDGPTPDVRDVPKGILDLLKAMGVCMTDLDSLIQSEIPVYDGEDCSDDEEEENKNE